MSEVARHKWLGRRSLVVNSSPGSKSKTTPVNDLAICASGTRRRPPAGSTMSTVPRRRRSNTT
jgi:hypothetical protein